MAPPSPPQLSCSDLSGPPVNSPRLLDLADNASRQPDQLEEPENIDDANSRGAELSAAAPIVALSFQQLSKDQDDPHHLPPPAPSARKWARTDEYYDAQIQAQREHMLSLGWNWEDNADYNAYKMYRRSVRRLESLPRFYLEKISVNLSIRKEVAKV
jgi:hypothetical protein